MKCEDCGKVLSRNWGGKYCPSCTEKRMTHIDNDELEKVANHLYSLSDDCPAELRQGIATVRQIVNEEFVAKCETIGSQTIWKLLKPHIDNLLAAQRQALRDEVMEAVGEYTDLHTKYEGAYDGTDGLYTSIEDNESQELTGDKLALLANFVSDKTVNELRTAISTIFEGRE